jgi:monoamine oxidase
MFDSIVIGAGFAGLTSTQKLIQAGKNVILLEANDRVGGRVLTKKFDDGTYLDLGAAWVGANQNRLYSLSRQFNTDIFPTYNKGKSKIHIHNEIKSYDGIIPPVSILSLLSLNNAIKKINKLSQCIDLENPWNTVNASDFDNMTLDTWMKNQIWVEDARTLFQIAIESIFAANPAEISFLHALFYIKSGQNLTTLMNIENGAQQNRFVGGMQPIAEKLATTFKENIRLNSVVYRIEQYDDHIKVFGKDFAFETKNVIVALPPHLAAKITYNPMLPANREQLTQRLPMGQVWKAYAVYDKPFWRELGFNGLTSSDSKFPTVTFDNSPSDGSKGILVGLILADRAKLFSNLDFNARKKSILDHFSFLFGKQASSPLLYYDHSWINEPFAGGCYASVFPTHVWTSLGHSLRKPIGNIHWAGTETATEWAGYVEGAIQSGERAALEIIRKG